MTPLITVAIAAYNVEKFIEKGIKNVITQTYSNLEIIIVDDGSTDSTPLLCDQLKEKDNRIKVIHKENGGLGSARNTGIENAKGKYIYFFDLDDSIENDLIERNVEVAENKNVDLIIFGFWVKNVDEDYEEKITLTERNIECNNDLKKAYIEELLFLKHGNGFVWNKFYRMSFLKKHKFRFGNQRIQQDEPFNMQLYPYLNKVYISNEAYYHYVIYNSGNAGTRYLHNKFDIYTDVYHKFMKLYGEWIIDDEKVLCYINDRYVSGIYNVLTYNFYHYDCKMTFIEKYKEIKKILNKEEVKLCVKFAYKESCSDPIKFCIKFKLVFLFIISNKCKLIIKKLIRH